MKKSQTKKRSVFKNLKKVRKPIGILYWEKTFQLSGLTLGVALLVINLICAKIQRFFGENLDFWRKFEFLTNISIFIQNFGFLRKFRFLNKIAIFEQNFDF